MKGLAFKVSKENEESGSELSWHFLLRVTWFSKLKHPLVGYPPIMITQGLKHNNKKMQTLATLPDLSKDDVRYYLIQTDISLHVNYIVRFNIKMKW